MKFLFVVASAIIAHSSVVLAGNNQLYFPLPEKAGGKYCWKCDSQTFNQGRSCLTYQSVQTHGYNVASECCKAIGGADDCSEKSESLTYSRDEALEFELDVNEMNIGYKFVPIKNDDPYSHKRGEHRIVPDDEQEINVPNECVRVVGVHERVSTTVCQRYCRSHFANVKVVEKTQLLKFLAESEMEDLCRHEDDLYTFDQLVDTDRPANHEFKCFSNIGYGYDVSDGGAEGHIGFFDNAQSAAQCRVFAEHFPNSLVMQYNAQKKECLIKSAKQIQTVLQMSLDNYDSAYCHIQFNNPNFCVRSQECRTCSGKNVCAWRRSIIVSGAKLCGKNEFDCDEDKPNKHTTQPTTETTTTKRHDQRPNIIPKELIEDYQRFYYTD